MTVTESFCRVCHACCPIVVEIGNDGRVATVSGDRANPLYGGCTCVKGRASPALHNGSDRLLHSMKRMSGGEYAAIPVEQAMDEIAARLHRLIDEHGPRAITGYVGTAVVANFALTFPAGTGFFQAIGSPMTFGSETIDQPGKNLAKGCHGMWMAPGNGWVDPYAVLLIGVNPLVSHGGFPLGHPGRWLSRNLSRGTQLVVIDPRRTEVARRATLQLQVRPGHDAALLAAMARVVIDEGRSDVYFLSENVRGVDELRHALTPFDPTTVARQAGIDADDLVLAARMYSGAARAYAACGTGPSMSESSTLIEYLRMNLETLCGNWQRAGDLVHNAESTARLTATAQALPRFPSYGDGFGEPSRVRGPGASIAGMPTSALAEEILLPGDGQVRALVSCGGNPVAAWPDQLRTIEAMNALDLLASIDPRMTSTGRLSDYVIAPKMSFEFPGITFLADMFQHLGTGFGLAESYGQYTPAVVEPPPGSDLIEEWEFYYGLAQRLGVVLSLPHWAPGESAPLQLDMEHKPSSDELLEIHLTHSRISLDELKRQPHGALFPDPAVRVAPKDDGWNGRLDVANADMLKDLASIGASPTRRWTPWARTRSGSSPAA